MSRQLVSHFYSVEYFTLPIIAFCLKSKFRLKEYILWKITLKTFQAQHQGNDRQAEQDPVWEAGGSSKDTVKKWSQIMLHSCVSHVHLKPTVLSSVFHP